MSFKAFWIAVSVLVAFGAAFAQDPTKVESSHYKLAFENESVQVVDVHYGPHEKSGMHDHPGGVVVVINGGHLRFTDQHGIVREVFSKAGESRWFPPFKHKVENLGDTSYDAVYVGMKNKRTVAKTNPANRPVPIEAHTARVLAESALASDRSQAHLK
jgi:quercetin dioxygenase-like cupin family protein